MTEPTVDLALALEHGLNEAEYHRICRILQRTPTFTELGIFSVMWSEHCSYKNSILQLKKLPRSGKHLLVEAGEENAGLIDIGDGLAVAFKIESHNHPSAVEPYQGAATGVGGILRDVFSMGARPIAALNSLRFGNLDNPRVRYLLRGVVKGIGDYGNCFGVPTVGGEIYFEDSYTGNPLVNAMAVGIVKHDRTASAIATGAGNSVTLIGSATGRDGIHGATFASEEISEKSEAKRPQVQVGDPFTEKLLLEACLEIIKADLIVGIQDMGAAGITCSTSEMAAAGAHGIAIDLEKVPLRERGMTPYEIMLSESQERMLVIARPGKEGEIKEICEKWDLNAATIGTVRAGANVQVRMNGELCAEIPAAVLVLGGGAPVYEREAREPAYLRETLAFDPRAIAAPGDLAEVLLRLLATPNIANKHWVYDQYDSTVRSNTVIVPGGDAAVVRIKGTRKALALKTDCNGRYVYLNPRRGAAIAVAESARNVAATGARPVAITNCLNFGNPYDPEVYWQFQEVIAGMREACLAFDTPVTGGNVSFYNESPEAAVYPTPVIGMVGVLDDVSKATTSFFKRVGDEIALLGHNREEIGGSEYLKTIHGLVAGDCPALDLEAERSLHQTCLALITAGLLQSCHDVADGGLAVALAECCIMNAEQPLGAQINLPSYQRLDAFLLGESQSLVVVSYAPAQRSRVQAICAEHGVLFTVLGQVGGEELEISSHFTVALDQMHDAYFNSLARLLQQN